ncbi:unnamed protein product [Arabis nemorensis]|uniref:Uncharacterized protein n=1 Tax=Arabis nemorensis TaxID=586526 RepID=A0A565BGS9_9BRAS|nr:unnamed protein product [Arabis nemorensis]
MAKDFKGNEDVDLLKKIESDYYMQGVGANYFKRNLSDKDKAEQWRKYVLGNSKTHTKVTTSVVFN